MIPTIVFEQVRVLEVNEEMVLYEFPITGPGESMMRWIPRHKIADLWITSVTEVGLVGDLELFQSTVKEYGLLNTTAKSRKEP